MDAIRAFVQTLLPFEFMQFDFMVNALLAILLLTPLLGLLGTMAVNQQMAFFSDALGHSALTGIGLGIVLGMHDDLLSMLIFGGSLEFVCVEMLLSPFAPVQVLIMAVMIQARHLFYGLSMLDKFKGLGWKKYYLIFGMCDETFSVNYTSEIPEDVDRGWFYFFVTLLNQFYWVASATIGGIIGSLLKFDTSGISFVMTAMFVVIFLDQWMKEKIHVSSMIGILVSLVCLILFGADSFMIPTMILIVLLLTVLRKWLEQCDKIKEKEEPTK